MSVLGYAGNVKKLWAETALIEWVWGPAWGGQLGADGAGA